MLPPAKRQKVRDRWHEMKYYFSWERIKQQHGGGGGRKSCFFLCFLFITYIVPHCLYMVWLKEKRKTLLHDQTVYIYNYYVDMNMMYVNC